MKKLLVFVMGVAAIALTSCNKKTPKVTTADKWYITGSATYFTGKEDAAQLSTINLDADKSNGVTETDVILGNFAFLKAGSFSIELKDGSTVYGGTKKADKHADNNESAAVIGAVYSLTKGGNAIQVTKPGMYFVAFNKNLKELTVVEVSWGLIGDAINGWSEELALGDAQYNNGVVTWEKTNVTIKQGSYKFRYGSAWGVTLDLDASTTVNTFSDITGLLKGDANVLSSTLAQLKTGGDNLVNTTAGIYTVTLQYTISDAIYKAKIVKTGEYVPSYPENIYFTGASYLGWSWDEGKYGTMVQTTLEGKFWAFAYLKKDVADAGFKFTTDLSKGWDASFGVGSLISDGKYNKGNDNAQVPADGVYQIVVDLVNNTVTIEKPVVYLLGAVVGNVWGADAFVDANKFTVDDTAGTLTSPAFAAAGELRMCMRNEFIPAGDWWQAEFIVLDGKIAYRGKGGDQTRVNVTAGQKVVLNIKNGTGVIQ